MAEALPPFVQLTTDYIVLILILDWTNLLDGKSLPGIAFKRKYGISIVVAKAVAHGNQDIETTPPIHVLILRSIGGFADFLSRCNIRLFCCWGGGKGGGGAPSPGALSTEISSSEVMILLQQRKRWMEDGRGGGRKR